MLTLGSSQAAMCISDKSVAREISVPLVAVLSLKFPRISYSCSAAGGAETSEVGSQRVIRSICFRSSLFNNMLLQHHSSHLFCGIGNSIFLCGCFLSQSHLSDAGEFHLKKAAANSEIQETLSTLFLWFS